MGRHKLSGKGRRVDKKGRSNGHDRFVMLKHYFLKSEAWRSLKPSRRAVYIELAQRYNGINNGEISMSVREAARLANIAKDTATLVFRELQEKGFIKAKQIGSFDWKLSHATTWILTEHPYQDNLATKEFMSWGKIKVGPN